MGTENDITEPVQLQIQIAFANQHAPSPHFYRRDLALRLADGDVQDAGPSHLKALLTNNAGFSLCGHQAIFYQVAT